MELLLLLVVVEGLVMELLLFVVVDVVLIE